MSASDRTKSINLELLEEMFQIEEKEKAINPGQFILWCLKMAPFKWEYGLNCFQMMTSRSSLSKVLRKS